MSGAQKLVVQYKARLDARGFQQLEGIDHFETFAPVVKFISIGMILSTAAVEDIHLHQMDVKTALLNGDPYEEVFTEQPEGYVLNEKEHCVRSLKKALYKLKQASRQWYFKIYSIFVNELRLTSNEADNFVYTGRMFGFVIITALYVDDLLLACSDKTTMVFVKERLEAKFEMKDLHEAKVVLGLGIHRNRQQKDIFLTHSLYSKRVLERSGLLLCKLVNTQIGLNGDIGCHSRLEQNALYREAIGSLMYLSVGSRPDICFAVPKLTKFVEIPHASHLEAVKRVLRYINGMVSKGHLFCSEQSLVLNGYVDVHWAGDNTNRKLVSGFLFKMAGAPIA